jgi:hypothetical protein
MSTSERRAHAERGSFIRWRREHLPEFSAILDGDLSHAAALADIREERNRAFDQTAMHCIECRSLMIHFGDGQFVCPYSRAGCHDLAAAWLKEVARNGMDNPL